MVKESSVTDIGVSDHSMVHCTLRISATKPPPQYIHARSYKPYIPSHFVFESSLLPFNQGLSMEDVNDKLNLFNQIFMNALNNHASVRCIRIKGRTQSFINEDIKLLTDSRDRMLIIFRATHNTEDWEKYNNMRNLVKSSLRKTGTYNYYVRTQIRNCKGDSRTTWNVIMRWIPTKESTNSCYQKALSETVEEFHAYFTSVGKSTTDSVRKFTEENGVSIIPPESLNELQSYNFNIIGRSVRVFGSYFRRSAENNSGNTIK